MAWDGVSTTVTGAGGFIGSHLAEHLVRAGANVRAFVHYNGRSDWANLARLDPAVRADLDIVAGDILDPSSVARAIQRSEVVFHLAALIGVPYSYAAPWSYVATNVHGTLNVLEAIRAQNGTRLVHASTSETYGTARYVPIDEHHPLQGQSPYSASKIGADKLVESYVSAFGLPAVTLRPFNTFGPRQSLRAVIPTIIAQALTSDVISVGALDPIRDFTFVTDTARAFAAVAEHDKAIGQTLNAGTGRGIRIRDLATLIANLVGLPDAPIASDPARMRPERSEVYELVCDHRRLRDTTGWHPEVTLEDGLGQTIDFLRGSGGLPQRGAAARYAV